ncbi:bifunctional serine/threonine-protein kinase/ABC transporter substrate-binding protein [Nocardia huaxiensis]|uniref:non-specific serine/threonine protein kinase n=1 Tax=Nocardia huaxiensis TaxID=2755382 RepID=A0A7D6VGG4_9NOCA|nr:bifunctional serine/threonine-protein kinase/ABC transporter substrate-binding protein [Nocardia huaxiensis]QLY33902.1 ABC transporter substrate-binding protein [Nocardia huaxiensis]UFS99166.1 bifunctional serine/threonine-protein kinase/ABC transporter substrate-binding protein [Nocardia huaxiensis]
MLRAGEVFAGYVIERWLGDGDLGESYLARHMRLPRHVVIQLLHPEFGADAQVRARFEQEAEQAARLDHPNVVPVPDCGFEGDRLWIVSPYIDGADASSAVAMLPPVGAVHIVAEVAAALDYAHAAGVLHRDVRPATIVLARPAPGYGARILLSNFGIGFLRGETTALPWSGMRTGALGCVSPEQLSGQGAEPRSDQYSLACCLYWLLSGSAPFEGVHAAEVIDGHLHRPPPSVSARRSMVPAAMDEVLARALAKDPAERFGSCAEFAAEAARVLTEAPAAVAKASSGPVAANVEKRLAQVNSKYMQARAAARRAMPEPDRQGRGRLVAGAIVLVVLLGAVVGIAWLDEDSGTNAPAESGTVAATPTSGGAPRGASLEAMPPDSGFTPLSLIDPRGQAVPDVTAGPYPADFGTGATCAPASIAMAGALAGEYQLSGRSVLGGIRLALDHFTRANPGCPVSIREFDTGGMPATAAQIVPNLAADPSTLAVIGPVFSAETLAAGTTLNDAGLPFLTPSAGGSALTTAGWHGFLRGTASTDVQASALGGYLTTTAHYGRVCVLSDGTESGLSLAQGITSAAGGIVDQSCSAALPPGADPAALIATIAAAAPDAIVYGGYASAAAPMLLSLRAAGITAPFLAGDDAFDPAFTHAVGDAGKGSVLACACAPVTAGFRADYTAATGESPGIYAAEAYDLTAIVLRGIASGHTTRADLLTYLRAYRGTGIAHSYGWTETGEPADPRIWLYRAG